MKHLVGIFISMVVLCLLICGTACASIPLPDLSQMFTGKDTQISKPAGDTITYITADPSSGKVTV